MDDFGAGCGGVEHGVVRDSNRMDHEVVRNSNKMVHEVVGDLDRMDHEVVRESDRMGLAGIECWDMAEEDTVGAVGCRRCIHWEDIEAAGLVDSLEVDSCLLHSCLLGHLEKVLVFDRSVDTHRSLTHALGCQHILLLGLHDYCLVLAHDSLSLHGRICHCSHPEDDLEVVDSTGQLGREVEVEEEK